MAWSYHCAITRHRAAGSKKDTKTAKNRDNPASPAGLIYWFLRRNVIVAATSYCAYDIGMSVILTPQQCKAARALLDWKQRDLAEKATVAVSTIADFERGERQPIQNNLQAMRFAFEAAGVTLRDGGAVLA